MVAGRLFEGPQHACDGFTANYIDGIEHGSTTSYGPIQSVDLGLAPIPLSVYER